MKSDIILIDNQGKGFTEALSSAGLRVLLYAKRTMWGKGTMKVINVNELVQEVFEVTGFSGFLTIE